MRKLIFKKNHEIGIKPRNNENLPCLCLHFPCTTFILVLQKPHPG